MTLAFSLAHSQVFDPGLLSFAITLTHSLDESFGLPPKRTLSLRDVPGLTRAALPILAASGVRAITGGVNGFSAPPGVPKCTPFRWRDEASGAQLLAMWHPGEPGRSSVCCAGRVAGATCVPAGPHRTHAAAAASCWE